MLAPLGHLDDCAGNHYRLQLNAYRYILQKYYDVSVKAMVVVGTHPDNGDEPFIDYVPLLQQETEQMMRYQRDRARETMAMQGEDCLLLDPHGAGGFDDEEGDAFADLSQVLAADGYLEPHVGDRPDTVMAPTDRASASNAGAAASSSGSSVKDHIKADGTCLPAPEEHNAVTPDGVSEASAMEEDGDDDIPSELKRRRLLPGAAETEAEFDSIFDLFEEEFSRQAATATPTRPSGDMQIMQMRESLLTRVRDFHQDWDSDMIRLAVCALAIYGLRLVDMWHREHALLLWVIEGQVFLRSHNRTVYVYTNEGAFQPLKETPPEHLFGRVKASLLQLEGAFRLMPGGVRRDDISVLQALKDLRSKHDTTEKFLHACKDAAIFCMGNAPARLRRRSSMPAEVDEAAGEDSMPPPGLGDRTSDQVPNQWPVYTAQALSKVGASMQRELLDDKLFTYISRWCNSPNPARPGCAYTDVSVLYDVDGEWPVVHVPRSPDNNIYIRIPHPLMDPVLAHVKTQLRQFYKRTFWCNNYVFLCCQAAQALAKRGQNIDRLFIGISPGGVGQSLYSGHLHAIFEDNSAFFDPNVWYHDDELRKQAWHGNGKLRQPLV